MAKSDRSSYICANWPNKNIQMGSTNYRPGNVKYFLMHKITIKKNDKDVCVQSLLAYVSWYKEHEEQNYLHFPVTIWSPLFEPLSFASFIPISRILCRCAQIETNMNFIERPYNNGKVVIVIPSEYIQ